MSGCSVQAQLRQRIADFVVFDAEEHSYPSRSECDTQGLFRAVGLH